MTLKWWQLKENLKYPKNNLIPKVKVTAFSPSQRHFLSLKPMCLLCVNIMWFNHLHATTGQPLGDTCPVQRCRCVLANNAVEEVQMNPGAPRGLVYLTPWPASQSAVRPLLTVDRGMICRVTGASVWRAARLYTTETLPRWQTVSLLVTVNSRRVQLERLYSALIYRKLKLTSDYKYIHLCVCSRSCMWSIKSTQRLMFSHTELKEFSVSGVLLKTGDSPVLETLAHKKKKHKAKP